MKKVISKNTIKVDGKNIIQKKNIGLDFPQTELLLCENKKTHNGRFFQCG